MNNMNYYLNNQVLLGREFSRDLIGFNRFKQI